ncbi:triple QxxK/R motif-containing protein [Eurytemora carolleeae]|uniref:triple QxxK/R motif-containing protein n=1 Tax=Eurytemora carolleeae TaxID=1294199 RepID=UPI000C7916E1|nr:triple QxxK/R motif-containing protein [Eurytemora carolleeae]XP_023324148.1 triple QxxK/R motif-containing protein [Eurytemora carolleeae]XP_023324149.1 triple QxxK/R motif-containing protein [Eurytemora carolleeae]XP_023324150.1 triple QxxK/R motif-containing protein [Eurytemora carolleeae]|eukprot:XP_023324147.1 triple QxxK/R motif-containing protein-like [Eurytemora affinis]
MGRKGSQGGGGGGGKDSVQLPPVDLYRKRIGRQDSRKEKVHLKEVKQLQEAKEGRGLALKDSFLILVAVGAVFLAVYAVLFFSIN